VLEMDRGDGSVRLLSRGFGGVETKALSARRPTRHSNLVPRNSVLNVVPKG